MADLKNRKLIFLKGALFLVIIVVCSAIILFERPSWRLAALLGLLIWASARFYYFLFYVIEKYVDSDYRFAGVYSALRYLLLKRKDDDSSA